MRSIIKNFEGFFPTKHKALLGVIIFSAMLYVPTGTGGSESQVAGSGSHKAVPNNARVPSQTASTTAGHEAKKGSSGQAPLWRTVRMRVTAYCSMSG